MTFPPNSNFPRKLTIRKSPEFKEVFKRGKNFRTKYFKIYYKKNSLGFPRLGIVIGKNIFASAVKRNLLKRLLRETFRKNKNKFGSNDVVFLSIEGTELLNYKIIEQEIINKLSLN
ncbi:ribonuclease P protein component [Desulfobacterota bacterium AH_259_B03_O07]|nr:ribonuclease P protein component [Desulfobacterota bacterium AH_259_B03_O07]